MSRATAPVIKLFLEGVQVPVTSCSVTVTQGAPSLARIRVPPVKQLERIELEAPRMLAHVFFFDRFFKKEGSSTPQGEKRLKDWKLLFEGEVTGVSYTRSATGQRAYNLVCEDFSNYWKYTGTYVMATSLLNNFVDYINYAAFDPQLNDIFNVFTGPIQEETFQNNLIAQLRKNKYKNIPAAFRLMFNELWTANAFFIDREGKLKLKTQPDTEGGEVELTSKKGRLRIADDAEAAKITKNIDVSALDKFFGQKTVEMPRERSFMEILNELLELFFYQFWPVSCPPAVDGIPASWMIKPNSFFSAPPKCNVLVRDLFSSVSYDRGFLTEPTRFKMVGMPQQDDKGRVFSNWFYAPDAMAQVLQIVKGTPDPAAATFDADLVRDIKDAKNISPALTYQAIMKLDTLPVESREDLKGIIEASRIIPNYAWSLAKSKEDTDDVTGYLSNVARYYLTLEQRARRSVNVGGPFNPYILVGFPIAVIEEEFIYLGECGLVTHTIDANGDASTAITLSYMSREDTFEFETTIEDPFRKGVQSVPPWINKKYHGDKIGTDEGALKDLFGDKIGTIYDIAGYSQGNISIKSAAIFARINRNIAARKGNLKEFLDDIQERPIAEMQDVFTTLGAVLGPGTLEPDDVVPNQFLSDSFREVNQEIARELAEEMAKVGLEG